MTVKYKASQFATEWRDDADSHASDVPPAARERAEDAQYAGDFATLVALFRTDIAGYNGTAAAFAGELRTLANRLTDDGPGADHLFHQQVFSDWGPQAVLRALATAYAQPHHEMGELEGD